MPNQVKSDLIFNERLTDFSVDICRWREQYFSSVFNEKIITSDIDADSIVEMIYRDLENEG